MKKYLIIIISFFMILLTLSCTIYSDGWDITGDPDPEEVAREQLLRQMETQISEQPVQEPEDSTAEDRPNGISVNQVTAPGDQPKQAGENEYAVSATDFNCICSIDSPTRSVNLEFNGDELTYAGEVYNKIADNTYKYSFMGYYILNSGEGENKTSTKVDEEHHSVIILTEDGFVMEHYKGEESSPCCYHTFTLNK